MKTNKFIFILVKGEFSSYKHSVVVFPGVKIRGIGRHMRHVRGETSHHACASAYESNKASET